MFEELLNTPWVELTGKLDRLPHALLIHGNPGVGKLKLAERFAQLLLCERREQRGEPCGSCDGCRWFQVSSHPDVHYLEPEALARHPVVDDDNEDELPKEKKKPSLQIRIEQTRALADFVNLASHRGGYRVAIIHPAEDMNIATANSLLKNLEEPPPSVVFLLVSHRPARLLPTIRSRCVPVPVPLPEAGAAAQWLGAQGVREPGRWLAFAGGAPLRALAYATGERGTAIERVIRSIASGDRAALGAVNDREAVEPLAEVLQKIALDHAFAALTGRTKYSMAAAASPAGDARAWLAYARAMGRHRLLIRHPLNPKLFAADMVAGMPWS